METLAKAAYWYYVQDLSQKQVARRLGTSQSNVSRLMRSAREQGVVTFDISYPIHRELDLEDELRSAFDEFGVRDVVVSRSQVLWARDRVASLSPGMPPRRLAFRPCAL